MSGHHDKVRSVLQSLVRNDLRRIALTEYSSRFDVIQRGAEKIGQLFCGFFRWSSLNVCTSGER